jgi:excisionase family DNA binding protein
MPYSRIVTIAQFDRTVQMTSDTVSPLAVRVETAAKMFDTSPTTIALWLRTGRLSGFKVGRSWRVRVSDLQALLDGEARAR